jgi:uridine kinase
MKEVGKYNFDHPDAFDWPLLRATLAQLLNYQDVEIPNYNYTTCRRDAGPPIPLKCTHLILFEGIFALWDEELRREMDLKIFVHSDDDVRLLRRLKRDVVHRGRTIEGVIKSYNRFVKAAYDEYIKPVSDQDNTFYLRIYD